MNLEEAIKRIKELEEEVSVLKQEIDELKNKPQAGRKLHNESWTASYNDFVYEYENGHSIIEIVKLGKVSRRTAYRYLKYYKTVNQMQNENSILSEVKPIAKKSKTIR